MANYYFLSTLLPELAIGETPEVAFFEFEQLTNDNLRAYDLKKIEVVRRLYDLENLRAIWKEEPLDFRGTLTETDLEEVLAGHGGLPFYVSDFLEKYEKTEERLHFFSKLIVDYFENEKENASGFLKNYLSFERAFRLVLVGFRAKKLGRNLVQELQFEDPNETVVGQILAQKDAPYFDPPEGFEALKTLFQDHYNAPLQLQRALLEWKFSQIDEMLGFDMFSIDRILGYLAKLMIVEKWQELNEKMGLNLVDTLVKEVK